MSPIIKSLLSVLLCFGITAVFAGTTLNHQLPRYGYVSTDLAGGSRQTTTAQEPTYKYDYLGTCRAYNVPFLGTSFDCTLKSGGYFYWKSSEIKGSMNFVGGVDLHTDLTLDELKKLGVVKFEKVIVPTIGHHKFRFYKDDKKIATMDVAAAGFADKEVTGKGQFTSDTKINLNAYPGHYEINNSARFPITWEILGTMELPSGDIECNVTDVIQKGTLDSGTNISENTNFSDLCITASPQSAIGPKTPSRLFHANQCSLSIQGTADNLKIIGSEGCGMGLNGLK